MSDRSNTRRASLALGPVALVMSALLATSALAQTAAPTAKPVAPGAAPAAAAPARPAAPAAAPAAPAAGAAAKPAAAPAAAASGQDLPPGTPNSWVKICSKDGTGKNICLTAQELRGQDNKVVASVALRETEGDPQKVLLIAVPPMMLIQPGLKLVVDKNKPEDGKYMICYPNSCFAEAAISAPFYNSLRTGSNLTLVTMNAQNNKQVGLPIKLAGFKLANDGPAINPQTGQAAPAPEPANNEFMEAAKKRAEQERLRAQQTAPKP